ncbi:MAG: hypothetical protein ACK4WF_04140 [Candidatus Brocadiales bacterium]
MKKRKEERTRKLKIGITLEPETLIWLEEIRMSYVREGKKLPKRGEVIKEALGRLWEEVVGKK